MKTPPLLPLVLLLVGAAGCSIAAQARSGRPPLESEGEVYLYVAPFPREAGGLSFTLASVGVSGGQGTLAPMELVQPSLEGGSFASARLLAIGRLPPGEYVGFAVTAAKASKDGAGKATLAVPIDPTRTPFRFRVAARRATLVELALDLGAATAGGGFTPAFTASIPAKTPWQLVGYTSNSAWSSLTVFDKRTRVVTDVVATGREPLGMALEPRANRLYVALAGDDALAVVDVAAGEPVNRINLQAGDRPRDLVALSDGTLLVVNTGTRTASFVDPVSSQILARVPVGDQPWSITLDRRQPRAYVMNRWSNNVTVIDVSNRTVVATIPTGPEPLWAQPNRAGTRLYLLCAGSPYMDVLTLPGLTVATRVYVGLGASALRVDPRSDLVYVAMAGEHRVRAFEPYSLLPVDEFAVPAPVSFLAIDELDNTLIALLSGRNGVAVIDLTSRRVLAELDVGADPNQVVLASGNR